MSSVFCCKLKINSAPSHPLPPCCLLLPADAMATRKDVRDFFGKLKSTGAVSVFNEPDLLDDLLDDWNSSTHSQERLMVVRRLQVTM